ncbi:MAG: ABC transporter permease [Acidobacteriaceae bacterium]
MSHPLRAFRLRFSALLRRHRQQRDYAEELAFHQHMLRERLEREGTPPAELDTATRRTFGNPSRLREQLSELRQFSRIENIFRDLGYAARLLRKSPGFTVTAILTIALGIGASTAIFSLINGLLLRPLDVPDAHQLAVIGNAERRIDYSFCAPLFRSIERNHPAFSDVFAYSNTQFQIGASGGSTLVSSLLVSGQFFRALQTAPLLGRYLTPADDQPGYPSGLPAVVTQRYWRDVLHGNPRVIGSKLIVNKVPFTIVGVMPERFMGTDPTMHPQIFIPLATEPLVDAPYNNTAGGYHSWWLVVMGRMKPGVTLEQANASLASVARGILDEKDSDAKGAADWIKDARASHFRLTAESGSTGYTWLRRLFRKPLQAILALCGGMLLLACLNLASLLFARAANRGRELATRLAIGASRRRLLQQLLLESLLLAFAGSVAGLAAAPFVARSLANLLLGGVDPSIYLDASLDWRVLSAAACACVVATLVIGVAPALHATGRSLSAQLKISPATGTNAHIGVLPRLLLSTQIALALVLVIGAGLISTSLVRMYRTGAGFDPHNINLISVRMTKQPLEGAPLIQRYHSLIDKFQALPGVRQASLVDIIPFTGSYAESDYKRPGQQALHLYENLVGPGYFQTMRIPLLAGRDFSWSDTTPIKADSDPTKPNAAKELPSKLILSHSAAEHLFPRENPVGRILESEDHVSYEVIGVVGDTKYGDIREPAPPEVYTSITQNKDKKPSYAFVARSEGPAAPFAGAVRAILARDVPEIPAPVFNTLGGFLDQSLSAQRMMALLSIFFAACSLLVTAIGLYGTLAYRTARRTSEIGIRMALGAQRTQVVSLVFRQNVAVTVIGTLAGLAAALLAARALASFLYGTSTHDPLVLALSTLLLALVASVASLAPAIRAARINPLAAIRTE